MVEFDDNSHYLMSSIDLSTKRTSHRCKEWVLMRSIGQGKIPPLAVQLETPTRVTYIEELAIVRLESFINSP